MAEQAAASERASRNAEAAAQRAQRDAELAREAHHALLALDGLLTQRERELVGGTTQTPGTAAAPAGPLQDPPTAAIAPPAPELAGLEPLPAPGVAENRELLLALCKVRRGSFGGVSVFVATHETEGCESLTAAVPATDPTVPLCRLHVTLSKTRSVA